MDAEATAAIEVTVAIVAIVATAVIEARAKATDMVGVKVVMAQVDMEPLLMPAPPWQPHQQTKTLLPGMPTLSLTTTLNSLRTQLVIPTLNMVAMQAMWPGISSSTMLS